MIQSSTRNRSEQLIQQRRQQDQQISNLSTKLRQEHNEKTFAAWENKGKDIGQTKYVKDRMQQLREEAQAQKNQRKEKLAALLAEEHELYKNEILQSVETPDQVKERMMKQVEELRSRKEAERSKYADHQFERRFRDNADELRQVTQNFNCLQTNVYRDMQLIEKQKVLEDQYDEEMVYAQLYNRDIKRKERAEKEKEIQAKIKRDERNQIVGIQQQLNQQSKQRQAEIEELEKHMLRQEWLKEEQRQKLASQKVQEYKNDINYEIAVNNEQQKEMRKMLKQQEKVQDKEMIQQVLEKEEAIARMEAAERNRQKEETRQFLLNFKNRANEYNANDQIKDKLINEENARQWNNREAVWKQEDDARVKLMYEVYDQRAENVGQKKQQIEEEKQLKQIEKDTLHKQMLIYQQEQEEKERIEQEKINRTKNNLLSQMDEKQQRQHLLREQKLLEEERLRKQKEEYEKKVELEKQKGRQLLDELRKQRPY